MNWKINKTSKKYIENAVTLPLLGTSDNEQKLSEAYRISITKVDKNSVISSIDSMLFWGIFLIPLRGDDKKSDLSI